jgi:hypothetical protein
MFLNSLLSFVKNMKWTQQSNTAQWNSFLVTTNDFLFYMQWALAACIAKHNMLKTMDGLWWTHTSFKSLQKKKLNFTVYNTVKYNKISEHSSSYKMLFIQKNFIIECLWNWCVVSKKEVASIDSAITLQFILPLSIYVIPCLMVRYLSGRNKVPTGNKARQ